MGHKVYVVAVNLLKQIDAPESAMRNVLVHYHSIKIHHSCINFFDPHIFSL